MKNICLLLIFVCLQVNSQTEGVHNTIIGMIVTPAVAYRHLGNSEITDVRNEVEDIIMGFHMGLKLGYQFNHSLGLESGLQYLHRGYRTKEMLAEGIYEADHIKIGYHFNYLGFPLKLVYRSESDKLIFTAKAGIIANILVKKAVVAYLYYKNDTKKVQGDFTEDDYSGIAMTSVISIGLGDKIGKNLYFEVEPTFLYDISSITTGSLKTHLWDIGLGLSLYYKI